MIKKKYTCIILFAICFGCNGFRNTTGFYQYRADWDRYETESADFEQNRAQCIAQKEAEARAEQKAKTDEIRRRQDEAAAREAVYASNPIVIHNRQLNQAIANVDIQNPKSIQALSDSLGATEIAHIMLRENPGEHRFMAEGNHCYLAIGVQLSGVKPLDGHWQTSDPTGYQSFRIPFFRIVPLPALSGICTTSEAELAYTLTQANISELQAIYIFDWPKSKIPDWLQSQMTVNVDRAICHPVRWRLLWQQAIPGTMYYYNNEPVLRLDYLPSNGQNELVTYSGKFYSLISIRDLRTTTDQVQLSEGFVHSCSERPMLYPGMGICADNKSVSTACCIENSKSKISAEMTVSEVRLHYCGGTSHEVAQSMEQASNNIRIWLSNKQQVETFDIVKMITSLIADSD